MRILFAELSPALRAGGIEQTCSDLAARLEQKGHSVFRRDQAWASSLAETRPDLVHFHGLWSMGHRELGRSCRQQGVPILVSPHGMLEPWAFRQKWWKKWPYFWMVERHRLRAATSLLATAPEEQQRLRSLTGHGSVYCIPLGTECAVNPDLEGARKRLALSESGCVVLFLSRLHHKKGLHLLLEALAQIEDLPGRLTLLVVGDGDSDYLRRCQITAKAKGLEGRIAIHWVGGVWGDKRWDFFRAADLYVLPTQSENFGLTVLEALQCGTRVLTTNTTPWQQLEGLGFGIVVTPSVKGLEEGLRQALRTAHSPAQRKRISSWANDRFAWERLIDTYISCYEETIRRTQHAG